MTASRPEGVPAARPEGVSSPYRHSVDVRYGEVDMQRVVFNAHYLAYCDDAVERWIRDRDVRADMTEWDFMLKKAEITWDGTAGHGDRIDIDLGVRKWGNTSFTVALRGTVGERPVFGAEIVYVGVRRGTTDTVPVPEAVRAALGIDAAPE